MPELDADCYLGVNFIRPFKFVLDPCTDELFLKKSNTAVPLEVAGMVIEGRELHSLAGLAEVLEDQCQQIQDLVGANTPPEGTALGCISWITRGIDVGETPPIKQKQFTLSPVVKGEMRRQAKAMLDSGVIEPSTSGWSSPVVMVRKVKQTDEDKVISYRFCVDFRKVNAVSKADAYPLPNMDGILRKLQKVKYISTLDLSSAYHQIPMEAGREITAFTVRGQQ